MKKALFVLVSLFCIAGCSAKIVGNSASTKQQKQLGMVVLGDSYSTFEGSIPEGYSIWYFKDNGKGNDVHSASQCWWDMVRREKGYKMLINSSYSGSCVCTTAYDAVPNYKNSFIGRAKVDIVKEDGTPGRCGVKPDIIFIFGGTNDCWSGAPRGELTENWEDADISQTFPAICYLLGYLRKNLPDARIIVINNSDICADIVDGYAEAAEMYGVESIQLRNISKQGGHPDIVGMRQIADQLKQIL